MKNILAVPDIFRLFNFLIGANGSRARFAHECIRARQGDRVLDIGCGIAEISEHLRHTQYYGFDVSAAYIEKAKAIHGDAVTLYQQEFSGDIVNTQTPFDIVLAIGLLHHLTDEQAIDLLTNIKKVLKRGGRFITFDGCYTPNQSSVARYLISKDRGQHVRTQEGYESLITKVFENYKATMANDFLRIPYTHIIFECTRS
jgi:2-polyprenyl-3-methyl-5-hydroxy-6-metoxy-1,4-benzoquinol methylase